VIAPKRLLPFVSFFLVDLVKVSMAEAPKNKRHRTQYIHNADALNISVASTARNDRRDVCQRPALPPSPEKTQRVYDAFDQAMGYDPQDDIFV
jgi:hypothetical protein